MDEHQNGNGSGANGKVRHLHPVSPTEPTESSLVLEILRDRLEEFEQDPGAIPASLVLIAVYHGAHGRLHGEMDVSGDLSVAELLYVLETSKLDALAVEECPDCGELE
jgi:hypothetical protein